MRKNRIYFYIVIAIAAVLGIILLFAVIEKEREEEIQQQKKDRVEKVENLIRNSSFEKELGRRDWSYSEDNNYQFGFDNLVKFIGDYSFNISSLNEEGESASIIQRIENIELDKKVTLLGFIRSEEIDSARFEIEFYKGDSLMIRGYSESVKGTTDWEEMNAWIKTYTTETEGNFSVVVKGIIYGNGRVWFDNIRVYSLPVDESIYNLRFDRVLN
jgi:hypothetical protein